MRIVCISDTHDQNLTTKFIIPDGDILVHVGDLCAVGDEPKRFWKMGNYMSRFPHPIKLYVPGNHDRLAWDSPGEVRAIMRDYGVSALFAEGYEAQGLKFWGCGWMQPTVNAKHSEYPGDFQELWERCPEGTDIVLSHQPPYGILDYSRVSGEHIGSTVLYWQINRRIRPRYHIFGHNHSGHGVHEIAGIRFVNAALCDDENKPYQQPIVIEVDEIKK